MKIIFIGFYSMVYTITKSNRSCISIHGITLEESNKYGGQLFMYLYTEKKKHCDDWIELPIDDDVVKRVEYLA